MRTTKNHKGAKVISVTPDSIAEQLGIKPGDHILSINNNEIYDKIDFFFLSSDIAFTISWKDASGKTHRVGIEKDNYETESGIELEDFHPSKCGCNCMFCFINQLPKGLRKTLYLKDEDYRLSFFHGNYITGVNLSDKDLARIKKYNLSPIYLSIHAMEPQLRKKILGTKLNANPKPLLNYLKKNRIQFHSQIVLCPGINDKENLKHTIKELLKYESILLSIAVVPVGLTAHRTKLPQLNPVTPEYAEEFIKEFAPVQKQISSEYGRDILFFSDEFYLLADKTPYKIKQIDELHQIENGVGMYTSFYREINKAVKLLPEKLSKPLKVGIITSPLGEKVLQKALDILKKVKNLTVNTLVTENTLFGKSVTVTGLLPGKDIIKTIKQNPGYHRYLIPENSLKYPEKVFLDDISFEELKHYTDYELIIVEDGIKNLFINCVRNKNDRKN